MRIRLAENFRALFYAPFYATHVLGFYAGEGIVVDLFNSPAPASAAAGLLDGSIDISWGGPMRVMKARDLDPASPLVCFARLPHAIRSFWSASANVPASIWLICHG
jgi:NitT/TauT family transport system substrate-binding protein